MNNFIPFIYIFMAWPRTVNKKNNFFDVAEEYYRTYQWYQLTIHYTHIYPNWTAQISAYPTSKNTAKTIQKDWIIRKEILHSTKRITILYFQELLEFSGLWDQKNLTWESFGDGYKFGSLASQLLFANNSSK